MAVDYPVTGGTDKDLQPVGTDMAQESPKQESKPAQPVIPEITGIGTAVEQMSKALAEFSATVRKAQSIEQEVLNFRAELNKKKDDRMFAALLAAQPDVEKKMEQDIADSSRKAVRSSVDQMAMHLRTVAELTAQINAKYGKIDSPSSVGGTGKVSPFKNGTSKPTITKQVIEQLSPDFIAKHGVTWQEIDNTGYYRVFGAGRHGEGTIYKKNLADW